MTTQLQFIIIIIIIIILQLPAITDVIVLSVTCHCMLSAHLHIFIINNMLSELPLLGISTCFIFLTDFFMFVYCGSTVVKVLCYKLEGRWFNPSWCQWNFH